MTRSEPRDGRTSWHIDVAGARVDDAAWTCADASGPLADLPGHVSFRWEAMDTWHEEAEQVFVHAVTRPSGWTSWNPRAMSRWAR